MDFLKTQHGCERIECVPLKDSYVRLRYKVVK